MQSKHLHWVSNIGNFICEENFDCDHSRGCNYFCQEHVKQSCSALINGIKLVTLNSDLKGLASKTSSILSTKSLKLCLNIFEKIF